MLNNDSKITITDETLERFALIVNHIVAPRSILFLVLCGCDNPIHSLAELRERIFYPRYCDKLNQCLGRYVKTPYTYGEGYFFFKHFNALLKRLDDDVAHAIATNTNPRFIDSVEYYRKAAEYYRLTSKDKFTL